MSADAIPLAKELDHVPSAIVPLDAEQEKRFQRLMEPLIRSMYTCILWFCPTIWISSPSICVATITDGVIKPSNMAAGPRWQLRTFSVT